MCLEGLCLSFFALEMLFNLLSSVRFHCDGSLGLPGECEVLLCNPVASYRSLLHCHACLHLFVTIPGLSLLPSVNLEINVRSLSSFPQFCILEPCPGVCWKLPTSVLANFSIFARYTLLNLISPHSVYSHPYFLHIHLLGIYCGQANCGRPDCR